MQEKEIIKMKKRQKKSSVDIRIVTLDTETRGLDGDIFKIGLFDGENYYSYYNTKELYIKLKEIAMGCELHVYVHNLAFDLGKMMDVLGKDINFSQSIFIESKVAIVQLNNGIIFHDTLQLFPGSLSKLCKDFGLGQASKIDLSEHILSLGWAVDREGNPVTCIEDMNKSASQEKYFLNVDADEEMLNTYLQFDCTSLHNIVSQVIKISGLDLEEFTMCATTAALAMKVYQCLFPDDYADACSSFYEGELGRFYEDVVRLAYYGGRTEVFIPNVLGGYHYDVTSLYPYVMKVNDFPVGSYKVIDDERKARQAYRTWKKNRKGNGILYCHIYIPEDLHIPPLPHKIPNKNGLKQVYHEIAEKLLFPVGKIEGSWTFPELEMAEKMGCVIEEYNQVFYWSKTEYIFTAYVEYFEKLKNTSTGAKRAFAKLCSNALYGKFGMQRERRTFVSKEEFEKKVEKGLLNEYQGVAYNHPLILEKIYRVPDIARAKYIQPHIAAFVTSYARMYLYQALVNPKHGKVAYCDTDSAVTEKKMNRKDVAEKEYGKWKLEQVIDEAIFLQPKVYMEKGLSPNKEGVWEQTTNVKFKGIPGDIQEQFTEETYRYFLDELKKQEKDEIVLFGKTEDGEDALFDKEYKQLQKFLTTLRKGDSFNTMIDLHKTMNLRAKQKREMDYINNTSSPHRLYEYGQEFDEMMQQQIIEEMQREADGIDPIKELVEEHGYIKIPHISSDYYYEYKALPISAQKKYFRKKGLPIDVFIENTSYKYIDDLFMKMYQLNK